MPACALYNDDQGDMRDEYAQCPYRDEEPLAESFSHTPVPNVARWKLHRGKRVLKNEQLIN
jgi:hypothetical protein